MSFPCTRSTLSASVLPVPTLGLKWTVADDCPVISSSLLGEKGLLQMKDFISFNFLEKSHPCLSSTLWELSHISQQGGISPAGVSGQHSSRWDKQVGYLCPKFTCVADIVMLWMKNAVMLSLRSPAALNIQNTDGPSVTGAQETQPGHPEQSRGRENKPKQWQQQSLPALIRAGGRENYCSVQI